jgi:hypothetical protein
MFIYITGNVNDPVVIEQDLHHCEEHDPGFLLGYINTHTPSGGQNYTSELNAHT